MRPSPSRPPDVAPTPATSVPICPLTQPALSAADPLSCLFSNDVVVLYVTALVYVSFDLFVFHVLSGWLTMLIELAELAPILVGGWLYWRARGQTAVRTGGLPPILYVPVLSTWIQLQILLFAWLERHIVLT